MGIHLPPFDPSREFESRRTGLIAGGKRYNRGEHFRKESVTARVLQQLYDQRAIYYLNESPLKMVEKHPAPPLPQLDHDHNGQAGGVANPAPLTGEEKAKLLVENNTHAQLLGLFDTLVAAGKAEALPRNSSKQVLADAIVKAEDGPA